MLTDCTAEEYISCGADLGQIFELLIPEATKSNQPLVRSQ